ncbi:predicted protein [Nematostella vectensis]|uniref:Monopolin complex subunit Csm1/Pcs1 C-terminal domain-containing protein n=1 Tax=Nematostella vectensis TaxID=45351 RepID=A7S6K1_NEMVE|nr:predicted protein [Nematostella vectensis]|eukprot:XP_001632729.1 predicted protein [Nematostella vectensis]
MPVFTRSGRKKTNRTCIEDPTPQTERRVRRTTATTGRRNVRISTKRKLLEDTNESEPPSKKSNTSKLTENSTPKQNSAISARTRSWGSLKNSLHKKKLALQKETVESEGEDVATSTVDKSEDSTCKTCRATRSSSILLAKVTESSTPQDLSVSSSSPCKEQDGEDLDEGGAGDDMCSSEGAGNDQTYKTLYLQSKNMPGSPARCTPKSTISARTRSWGSLRNSLHKKKLALQENELDSNGENIAAAVPEKLEESGSHRVTKGKRKKPGLDNKPPDLDVSSSSIADEEQANEVSVPFWDDNEYYDDTIDNNYIDVVADEIERNDLIMTRMDQSSDFYKAKLYLLLDAMKQIQSNFKKAQENAQGSLGTYDAFICELKKNLSTERERADGLEEELKRTRGELMEARKGLELAKSSIADLELAKSSNTELDLTKSPRRELEFANSPNVTLQENNKASIGVETSQESVMERSQAQPSESTSADKTMIKFYSMLTGISMTNDDPTAKLYDCFHCEYQLKGKKDRIVKFRLTLDKEFDEVEYSPIAQSPEEKELVSAFPDYLQDVIYFPADQAPRFLVKVLKSVQDL